MEPDDWQTLKIDDGLLLTRIINVKDSLSDEQLPMTFEDEELEQSALIITDIEKGGWKLGGE